MNNLIEPCKKYISDKINVDLSTEDATKYIMVAFNSLNFNNKTGLNKDDKKLILTSVLDFVNKDNSLENVLQTLENERNTPVLSIPYDFLVPFAVLENEGNLVKSFIEKPKYNFQTNGGIYLMKKEVLKLIPNDTFYNATDLIEKAISNDLKVISHSFKGYWIDIGRHDDFEKAKNEIEQVNFS